MKLTTLGAAAALLLCASIRTAEARVNATSAMEVFMITDCAECTKDGDSIFCTEASSDSNFVANATTRVTIRQKKQRFGAAEGARYCWEGTFGKLVNNKVTRYPEVLLNSRNVTADLDCNIRQLFYRQCVLPAEMTIILMTIASILCVCGTTCTCFFCGCCKCCNNPGDESRWGMCNRFCPWAPCADPPEKESEVAHHLVNPLSEEEHASSLFGKNPALKALEKPRSLGDIKKPNSPGVGTPTEERTEV